MVKRVVGRLSAAEVKAAKPKPEGSPSLLCGGGNLWLLTKAGKDGAIVQSWLFRYAIRGTIVSENPWPRGTLSGPFWQQGKPPSRLPRLPRSISKATAGMEEPPPSLLYGITRWSSTPSSASGQWM